jgi:predicted nucleic acid-binding protein
MLVTDTNILLRCSIGRAMRHVAALVERGVVLATTDRNAAEMLDRLVEKFGVGEAEAAAEVRRALAPFVVLSTNEYQGFAAAADGRLREGGKPDWPVLAAAMALEAEIWSEDTDFFGVGVPVWSTPNVRFAEAG